jgi:hexosaminidase
MRPRTLWITGAAVAVAAIVVGLALMLNGARVSIPQTAPTAGSSTPEPGITPSPTPSAPAAVARTVSIVPQPVSQRSLPTGGFVLAMTTRVVFNGAGSEATARWLADELWRTTGFTLSAVRGPAKPGDISLVVSAGSAPAGHAAEGYTLRCDSDGVRIAADTSTGLFWGVRSLQQLFPAVAERDAANKPIWSVPALVVSDYPRFAYRGAMLDVARHFFPVKDVKRYLDDLSLLKINYLHLHLTDDQGWRIQITGWPKLTSIGAQSEVGGGAGGFYTQDEYREIVDYAASLHITIVPEVDLPGHTNAALASYPELNCSGVAPARYTGTSVGFSSLCVDKDITYRFIDDVVRELAELTPGPYLHLGGDESLATSPADFLTFIARATAVAAKHGKTIIGWQEMGRSSRLPKGTVGQYWDFVTPRDDTGALAASFVRQGGAIIMSPADVAYLDMKYTKGDRMGQLWADGTTSVRESYSWEPDDIVPAVTDGAILGVEAPLWTESIVTIKEVEYMTFPRLAAVAEIGWSPKGTAGEHGFAGFRLRLAALGEYWTAAGTTFYRDPDIPWR